MRWGLWATSCKVVEILCDIYELIRTGAFAMDADLEAMRGFARFESCVECLLEPLLTKRVLTPMPCKHGRTFELARETRRRHCEDIGADDPEDDTLDQEEGYCDCGAGFDRRNALWELGDLCVNFNLGRTQMRELAAVLLVITTREFTYNHVKHAMHDMFNGVYRNYLKAYKRKRDKGASFEETMVGLVARWQWRMMPNI